MAAALLAAATAACGSGATMTTTSTYGNPTPSPPGCGDPVAGWAATDQPLAMTASFPAQVTVGGEEMVRGTVSVTNRSDAHVQGTSAAQPDVTLAREGKVVALPLGQRLVARVIDLPPGASVTYDAFASLRPCAAGPESTDRLQPGTYQVFASQQFDLDPGGPDRRQLVVRGGPWTISLV